MVRGPRGLGGTLSLHFPLPIICNLVRVVNHTYHMHPDDVQYKTPPPLFTYEVNVGKRRWGWGLKNCWNGRRQHIRGVDLSDKMAQSFIIIHVLSFSPTSMKAEWRCGISDSTSILISKPKEEDKPR
ncbi:hypothetical protein V6N11_026097 [Hibiscus sabdariffa]|uniref:Uncharacterized protein n=1 Tax=Hibiscus sabdariffa TaxID=183260 RepID=A0ABR2SUN3_9ROSI